MNWLAIDTETTGVDVATAKIVELALCGAEGPVFESRVDPDCHIPADATAIHGITDADVSDAPLFALIAPVVQQHLEGVGLVGYCHRSFDVLILDRELREAGLPGIDLDTVREIDLYRVWQEVEPRSLVGAVKRYCGRDHTEAHGALADATALVELLRAMAAAHGLTTAQMMAMSRPKDEVDRSGKFVRADDGQVLFNFSQHKGKPALSERGMLEWMLARDFPADSKAVVRRLLAAEVV